MARAERAAQVGESGHASRTRCKPGRGKLPQTPRARPTPTHDSDRHGFAVFAPDAAETMGDFADGSERFDAVENAREEIVARARGVFEKREGDLCLFGG